MSQLELTRNLLTWLFFIWNHWCTYFLIGSPSKLLMGNFHTSKQKLLKKRGYGATKAMSNWAITHITHKTISFTKVKDQCFPEQVPVKKFKVQRYNLQHLHRNCQNLSKISIQTTVFTLTVFPTRIVSSP